MPFRPLRRLVMPQLPPPAPSPSPLTPPEAARRRLLGWLASAGAVGTAPWLSACGGGGGGADGGGNAGNGGNNGNGGNGGTLGTAERAAALASVGQRWQALATQGTPATRAEAMAAHMATLPAYGETGFHAEAGCAWGRFKDGRAHIVCFTSPLPATGLAAGTTPTGADEGRAQALRAQLPQRHTAQALHSFGTGFTEGDAIVDALSGWLGARRYVLQNGPAGDASLTRLRQLQGLGYFYINTHGGAWGHVERTWEPVPGVPLPNDSPQMFAITSSTVYSAELERSAEMADDLDHWRLVYFTAANGWVDAQGQALCSEYYGITRHFVERYWRFADNAVVIINACSSARSDAQWASGFIVAVHRAGAGVYAGWTKTVSIVGADRAPRHFTDRLLGSNGQAPRMNPPQRAFPYDEVLAEMRAQGLDLDPLVGAQFVAVRNPLAADVQILAPAIHHCDVIEASEGLMLHGHFGSVPGRVEVGGQALNVVLWEKHKIHCQLPRSGPGSAGPVQVFVGAVFSNFRHITHWQVPVQLEFTDDSRPGLRVQGQGQIGLRADIGPRRDAPGAAPYRPVVYALAMAGSSIRCTAGGSYGGPPCTTTWSGSEDYTTGYADDTGGLPRAPLICWFKLDTATGSAALSLAFGMRSAGDQPYLESGCGTPVRFVRPIAPLDGEMHFSNPGLEYVSHELDALQLHAGSDHTLQRRGFLSEEMGLVISRAVPNHPPLASDEV